MANFNGAEIFKAKTFIRRALERVEGSFEIATFIFLRRLYFNVRKYMTSLRLIQVIRRMSYMANDLVMIKRKRRS